MSRTRIWPALSIGLMVASSVAIGGRMALAGNLEATPPNGKTVAPDIKQNAHTVTSLGTGVYQEAGLKIRFEYKPVAPQYIRALITNISETQILKPETHGFAYNEYTADGSFYAHLDSIKDNYGNSFRVSAIEPHLDSKFDGGINPGNTKEVKIFFVGTPIPATASLIVTVPRKVFGNDQDFEISLPLKNGVTSRIHRASDDIGKHQAGTPTAFSLAPVPRLDAARQVPNSNIPSTVTSPVPFMHSSANPLSNVTRCGTSCDVNPYNKYIFTSDAPVRPVPPLRPLPLMSSTEPTETSPLLQPGSYLEPDIATKESQIQNLGAYKAELESRIKRSWMPPMASNSGVIGVVSFDILQNGKECNLKLKCPSGLEVRDQAALKAAENACPFSPLPRSSSDRIHVEFAFKDHSLLTFVYGRGDEAVQDVKKLAEHTKARSRVADKLRLIPDGFRRLTGTRNANTNSNSVGSAIEVAPGLFYCPY